MKKKISALLLATFASYVIAVILITQFNLARIADMGFEVSLSDRLHSSASDLVGLYPYFGLILVALALAFLFAHFLLNRFIPPNIFTYAIVGFIGIVTIHIMMDWVFELILVAPTRTLIGLGAQGIAGAIGGLVYYYCNIKE